MPQPSTDIAHSALNLSERDVMRLLSEPSPDSRIEVMQKVASGYSGGSFNEREVALAEQIFRLLVRDTEMLVRKVLAETLAQERDIPRDIIVDLVQDVTEVSVPLLRYSEVLSDADLINIIRKSGEMTRLLAIAERPNVSDRVSSELIDTQAAEVIDALVKNEGASISERSFQTIIDRHIDHPTVAQAMVARGELPLTVVEKLLSRISDSLKDKLAEKYDLRIPAVSAETDRMRELATLRLAEGNVASTEVEKLVMQLYAFGRLTPSIILTALSRGNLLFFEMSLSRLAEIPHKNARLLIGDKGGLGFRALYEKSGLPDSMYHATRLVLDVVLEFAAAGQKPGSLHYANRLVSHILELAEGKDIDNLSYIIALIRQNAGP